MEGAIEQAYRRLGAKTTVPGFRKGKAPRAMLERYYGREAFVEDAAEHLLPEVYDRAIREHGVEAIAQPQVEVLQVEPLSFKATVPVTPTVELGDYTQIKFESETVEVTDEDVADALEKIRYMQGVWEPVERPAKDGDLLSIEVEGTVEGKSVVDQKEGWYHLAPDEPVGVPGFAEKLDGVEKGEERQFTLTLPEDYEQYGGQDCDFKVRVNEIKQKKLPELDDELAKSLGQGQETLDALKEKVAADLRSRKEWVAREKLEEKALEALVDIVKVEYHDVLVQTEVERLMAERERNLGDRQSLDDYLSRVGKTEQEYKEELRPMAERIVVRSLVLQRFAELEGVEVSADDIGAEVERITERASDERLREALSSTPFRESVGRNMFVRKALDRLLEITTGEALGVGSSEESAVSVVKEEEEGKNEDVAE